MHSRKAVPWVIHALKIDPEFFLAIYEGRKTSELRSETDRRFGVGDILWLREMAWQPSNGPGSPRYTGRYCLAEVTHVLRGEPWLAPSVASLSLRLLSDQSLDTVTTRTGHGTA